MSLRICTPDDASTLSLIGSATLLEAFAGLIPGHAILAHCRMNHTVAAWEKHLADPDNKALRARAAEVDRLRGDGLATVPSHLADELAENPFLRATTVAQLGTLRAQKDNFR